MNNIVWIYGFLKTLYSLHICLCKHKSHDMILAKNSYGRWMPLYATCQAPTCLVTDADTQFNRSRRRQNICWRLLTHNIGEWLVLSIAISSSLCITELNCTWATFTLEISKHFWNYPLVRFCAGKIQFISRGTGGPKTHLLPNSWIAAFSSEPFLDGILIVILKLQLHN